MKHKIHPTLNHNCDSLYVHIPFCQRICNYCDFPKYLFFNENIEEQYLESLFKEIKYYKFKKYKTIFIGGGTPTALKENNLEKLLKFLQKYFLPDGEFSIESNVESLTDKKIFLLKKYGVNRISIGVQALPKNLLNYLGRTHKKSEVENAIFRVKKYGIKNINLDFLYGFKGFEKKDIDEIFSFVKKVKITHLSFYPLSILPHTKLFNDKEKELDEKIVREQYDYICELIKKNSFVHYEVSNFAKGKKYECKHNLVYWNNEYYLGVGVGACSYLHKVRISVTKNILEYVKDPIDSKEIEKLKRKDEITYFLITNLRKIEGFSLSLFKEEFGFDFLLRKKKEIEKLQRQKLLIVKNDYMKASKEGIILLDIILRELI